MGLGLSGSEAEKALFFPIMLLKSKSSWNGGCAKAIITLSKRLDDSIHNSQLTPMNLVVTPEIVAYGRTQKRTKSSFCP